MAGNTEDDIIGGASNDDAESVLRKHLTSALAGPNWDGLVYALSRGDQINWDNAEAMLNQLNLSTAVADYLERRALDRGVKKPSSLGIGDEGFRQYAIKRSTVQTTSQVLYEMMEILYGSDAVRAHITSISGPFRLEEGDDLLLWIDKKKLVRVVFTAADFQSISDANTLEVATAITRACELNQSRAYAAESFDITTGESHVRLYSQTLGPSSTVDILGGKAQNVLQFPTLLDLYDGASPDFPGWEINYIPATGRTRFTAHDPEVGPPNNLDLNGLHPGDYVNVFGHQFHDANQGSFEVKDVYYASSTDQWFEVETVGDSQTPTQHNATDIMYFRRTPGTTFAGTRTVSIVQDQDEIRAVFPATSVAVSRTLYTGAYIHDNDTVGITSAERDYTGLVSVVTDANHGLSTGDWVELNGIYPDLDTPPTTAEDFTVPRTNYSVMSRMSEIKKNGWTYNGSIGGVAVGMGDGKVIHWGGHRDAALSSTYIYAPVSSTEVSPGSTYYTYDIETLTAIDSSNGAASWRDNHILSGSEVGLSMYSGGTNFAGTVLATAHEYDGTSIIARTSMNVARDSHTLTALNGISAFAVGGRDAGGVALASSELWDASTDAWTNKASMNVARYSHCAVNQASVGGGRGPVGAVDTFDDLLVMGGIGAGGAILASCEHYVLTAPRHGVGNYWTVIADMAYARSKFCAIHLDDNRLGFDTVMVIGGRGYNASQPAVPTALKTCEIFDAFDGRWYALENMGKARYGHTAQRVGNRIYVFGGLDENDIYVDEVEYYDLNTGRWYQAPSMAFARGLPTSAVTEGKILVIGGISHDAAFGGDFSGYVNKWELQIPASDSYYAGDFNGLRQVTVTSIDTFTYETPETQTYTKATGSGMTVAPIQSIADTEIPGPFIFDTDEGFDITDVSTTITQDLNQGHGYASVTVTSAADFEDTEGWLVFAFGTEDVAGPVKMLGKLSDTEILIDASFHFPETLLSGANVILLGQKGPLIPENAFELGALYATASSAGRIAASEVLDDMTATGFTVNKIVVFPGDRGLGAEGFPSESSNKLSDKVTVWGGNDPDGEYETAQEGD